MQYHLVPWLLTAAVFASPIAGAFDCDEGNRGGRLTIDSATPDKEIRRMKGLLLVVTTPAAGDYEGNHNGQHHDNEHSRGRDQQPVRRHVESRWHLLAGWSVFVG